jgi:tetratricopeptide (TPR) repeat protein
MDSFSVDRLDARSGDPSNDRGASRSKESKTSKGEGGAAASAPRRRGGRKASSSASAAATRGGRVEANRVAKIAVVPFAPLPADTHLQTLEHMLVFSFTELIEMLGGDRFVDLYPAPPNVADETDGDESAGPLAAREEEELSSEDVVREIENSDVDVVFSGTLAYRADRSVEALLVLARPDGAAKRLEWSYVFENVAEKRETDLEIHPEDLHAAVSELFQTVRKELRWRFSGPKERLAFYRWRLEKPLTPSYRALRDFVIARRRCGTADRKVYFYRRAVRHDPCFGEAFRNIAYIYKEQKKYAPAIETYKQSIRTLIDREVLAEAHAELGLCLANSGQLDLALKQWHLSRRWNPRNTDIYANIAIGYEEKGLIEKAIRFFNRAQAIDPNYYWACRGLGRIFCNLGDWKNAISQLKLQVSLAPKDAWGHYALGSCYAREGDPDRAREHLRRALELDPDGDAGRRAFQSLMQIEE